MAANAKLGSSNLPVFAPINGGFDPIAELNKMARPKSPKAVLQRVIADLEAERSDLHTSATRRRAINRQLVQAVTTLTRLERHADERKQAAPQPAQPTPAPAPEPPKTESPARQWLSDAELERRAKLPWAQRFSLIGGELEPEARSADDAKTDAPAAARQAPGSTYVQRTSEVLSTSKSKSKSESKSERESKSAEEVSSAPSLPAPSAENLQAGAVQKPDAVHTDPMPRLLWQKATLWPDVETKASLDQDFRLGLSRDFIAEQAAKRLENAARKDRPDGYAFRLNLLLAWCRRHREFNAAKITLPDERPASSVLPVNQSVEALSYWTLQHVARANPTPETPQESARTGGMWEGLPVIGDGPSAPTAPRAIHDDFRGHSLAGSGAPARPTPDGFAPIENPGADLRAFLRDAISGKVKDD